jgi:biotin carboxylase
MARFNQSLVANRRAIAFRTIRACRELGTPTATIYAEQEAPVLPAVKADQAVSMSLGPELLTPALPPQIIPEGDDHARAFSDVAHRLVSWQ